MDLQLRGHVAIVQGASRGIGRGIAESLAAEGVDLLLTARGPGPLDATARELSDRYKVKVEAFALDSGDAAAMPELVGRAEHSFGRLDIVVGNSGGPRAGGFRGLGDAEWRAAAELLLVAPAALFRAALPLLSRSPAPRIFVVTSSSTREPIAGLTLSNVFRPGLVGMVKTLAQELGADRVRCHSLAPGRISTERLEHLFELRSKDQGLSRDEVEAQMRRSIPAGRIGEPRDIGSLVAFLASPLADYLTGQNWLVDGGLVRAL